MTVIVDGTSGISTPTVNSSNGITVTGTLSVSNTVTFADSTSINTASSLGMRNRVINGGFDVWQRGTSISIANGGTNSYTSDRWTGEAAGGGGNATGSTVTWAQAADSSSTYGGNPYYMNISCSSFANTSSAPNSTLRIFQSIESTNMYDLAGKNAVLSFYASMTSASGGTFSGTVYLGYGTAVNDWSSSTYQTATFTPTSTPTRFVLPFSLASGFKNGCRLYITVVNTGTTASTVNLNIGSIQLESGTSATPFEKRLFGNELALCQRYFCKSYNSDIAPAAATTVGATAFYSPTSQGNRPIIQTYFPVTMRATPTVTAYSPNNGATGNFYNADQTTNVAVSSINVGASGATWYVNSAMTVGVYGIGHWTASAEL
jgi:hypothetical protein